MDGSGPRRVSPPAASTECHRGILTIDDPLPAFAYQPSLTCQPLGGRVWTVSDGIYRTVFCEGNRGIVAFDTFYSPGAAIAYRKTLNRIFPDKPIHTLVYSHDHLDHTGFGADLAPDAEVIAHSECAAVVEARSSDGQLPVTTTFEGDETEYDIDGVRFELRHPGPTHGNGNLCVGFPEVGVLFMVDTVVAGVGYTFLPDYHMASYLSSMRRALSEAGPWTTFIPGHFWPLDREAVEASLRFHEEVEHAARDALVEGVDPDDFAACHSYAVRRLGAQYGGLFRFQEYAGMNLIRAMLHLREGGWGLEEVPVGASGESAIVLRVASELDVRRPPALDRERLGSGVTVVGAGGRYAAHWSAPDGPVCIGTLGTPQAARRLSTELAGAATDAVVVMASDHVDESGFVRELGASRVVVHELGLRALEAKLGTDRWPSTDVLTGAGAERDLNGERVTLLYPGPTFGTGTLAVHLPERSLLYVVGPRPDARYGLIGDIHLGGATPRWRRLLELEPETVVFSRGGAGTPEQLARACDYFDGLAYATQKAFADGVAVWDIRAMEEYARELLRGDFGDLEGFDEHVGIAAMRVVHHYLMGGWGLEDGLYPPLELAPEPSADRLLELDA